MWGKKKWWETKAIENKAESKHYKTWCVIKVVVGFVPNQWDPAYKYKAVAWDNVPESIDFDTGSFVKRPHIQNLTQEEAVAMAKMLNFTEEVIY